MLNKKYLLFALIFISSCKKSLVPQTDIPIEVINKNNPMIIDLNDLDITDVNKYLSDLSSINTSLMNTDKKSVPPDHCVTMALGYILENIDNKKIPIKNLNALNYAVGDESPATATQCPEFPTKKLIEYAYAKYLNEPGVSNGKGIFPPAIIKEYKDRIEKNNCFKNTSAEFKDRVKIDKFTLNVFENSFTMLIPNIRIFYVKDNSLTSDSLENQDFDNYIKNNKDIILMAELPKNLPLGFKGSIDFETIDITQDKIQDLATSDARLLVHFGPLIPKKPDYFNEGDTAYYYLIEGELKFSIGFKGSVKPSFGMDAIDMGNCFYKEMKQEAKDEDRKRRDEYNKKRAERSKK